MNEYSQDKEENGWFNAMKRAREINKQKQTNKERIL